MKRSNATKGRYFQSFEKGVILVSLDRVVIYKTKSRVVEIKKRRMFVNRIKVSLIGMLMLFSCNNLKKDRTIDVKQVEGKLIDSLETVQKKKVYLKQKELTEYLKKVEPIALNSKYRAPFDTLKFDKVIAYDFDGREERNSSVINYRTGTFSRVILRQAELNESQINYLLDFITDNKTYGESTAACFNPHLGVVFYEGNKRKFVIDVCLDCNYLKSTIEIPATTHKKMKFEDGSSFGMKGFSASGKEHIIKLSRQLNLDYGKL